MADPWIEDFEKAENALDLKPIGPPIERARPTRVKRGQATLDARAAALAQNGPQANADASAVSSPHPSRENATEADSAPRPELIRASTVASRPISWLWPGWLAAGKLHVIGGAPGLAKTTIATDWASIITSSGRWPDGSRCRSSGDVLIWSGEDSIADTLRPRLEAAGADLDRVHFVGAVSDEHGERPFDPATDARGLMHAITDLPTVKLLIVDPLVSAVAGDSHKNAEVRRGLQPLVDLAEKLGIAVLGVTHFSKGTAGREPLERLTGSLAFGALARLVFGVAKLKDDEGEEYRALVRIKSNIGPDGGGFRYDVQHADIGSGIVASRIQWGEAIEGAAREILRDDQANGDDGEAGDGMTTVKDWLLNLIDEEGGSLDRRAVMKAAIAMGYKERTVHRAREKAGIVVNMHGFGKDKRSVWMRPASVIPANPTPFVPILPSKKPGTHGTNDGTDAGSPREEIEL